MLIPEWACVKPLRRAFTGETSFATPTARVKILLCAVALVLAVTPAANGWVRHRPQTGSTITYSGQDWTVTKSSERNPQIEIKTKAGKSRMQNITWADSDFWNKTPGDPNSTANNYDYRDQSKWHEDDSAYTTSGVCADFDRAMAKALEAVRAIILATYKKGQQQQVTRIADAIALTDFGGSKADNSPQHQCTSNPNNYSEWNLNKQILTLTWAITIDVDRPPAESPQEPHVGFTISDGTNRVIGHIWLNAVPVNRGGL